MNPVLDLGMLNIEEVVNSLKNRPEDLEIIITGRAAPSSLIRISQLHSEMRSRLKGDLNKSHRKINNSDGIEVYTC